MFLSGGRRADGRGPASRSGRLGQPATLRAGRRRGYNSRGGAEPPLRSFVAAAPGIPAGPHPSEIDVCLPCSPLPRSEGGAEGGGVARARDTMASRPPAPTATDNKAANNNVSSSSTRSSKSHPAWRGLPADERAAMKQEIADILEAFAERMLRPGLLDRRDARRLRPDALDRQRPPRRFPGADLQPVRVAGWAPTWRCRTRTWR